jgi:hypothetical protein
MQPYDAIPPPTHSYLCGGNPIRPLRITKDVRPILENLSKTALDHYQNEKVRYLLLEYTIQINIVCMFIHSLNYLFFLLNY